jgi:hypothetical protein
LSETSDLLAESTSSLTPLDEFFPRRFLRNAHLQTLMGNFKPRQYVLPEPEAHLVEVDSGSGTPTESKRRPMSVTTAQATCFAIAIGRQIRASV